MSDNLNPAMYYSLIDYNRYTHNITDKSNFVSLKCRIYIPNCCATAFTAKNVIYFKIIFIKFIFIYIIIIFRIFLLKKLDR